MLREGAAGEVYNVGGGDERENIEIVARILELTGADESLVRHVEDRAGHDRRYSLDTAKLRGARLGAAEAVRGGHRARRSPGTASNRDWWEPIKSGEYREYYERQYAERLAARRLLALLSRSAFSVSFRSLLISFRLPCTSSRAVEELDDARRTARARAA